MDGLDVLKTLFWGRVEEKETETVSITITLLGIWGLFDILEGHYNCILHNADGANFRLSKGDKYTLCKLISMFCNKEIDAYVFECAFDEVAGITTLNSRDHFTLFAKYLSDVDSDDWEECKILLPISDLDKQETDIYATLHDLGYKKNSSDDV